MRSLDSPAVDVMAAASDRRESPSGAALGSLGEPKHLMDRLNAAQIKVKRLHHLEAALVDFFMEVMDRSGTEAPASRELESTFARGKRKEQFLRKAEGDPISLLNALRMHLRLQFATQEAQQCSAARRASAQASQAEQKEQHAHEERQRLELACQELREQQQTLTRQLEQSGQEWTHTHHEQQAALSELQEELQDLRTREREAQELVEQQQQEIVELQEAKDTIAKLHRAKKATPGDDSKPTIVAAGASPGSTVDCTPATATGPPALHAKGESFGTPAENETLRRALRKFEATQARMEAASEERKREVQRLQQQLTGLRQNAQAQSFARLEKENRRVREQAEVLKREAMESEAELLRTKGALKEREHHAQQMKDEYARLFSAMQKLKQPSHYSPSRLARSSSGGQLTSTQQPTGSPHVTGDAAPTQATGEHGATASEHPYVLKHYHARIKRLELEAEALQLQIRRMMASEHRHKQKTRVLRAEKQQLVRERDQLQSELELATRRSAQLSIAASRQPQPRAAVRASAVSAAARTPLARSSGGPHELKRLQKRNAFLEERFRKTLQDATPASGVGVVGRLRTSLSMPTGLSDAGDDVDLEEPREEEEEASSALTCSKLRSASALATPTRTSTADGADAFRSLDAATLQSLQQVKRVTRVRPQSATSATRVANLDP